MEFSRKYNGIAPLDKFMSIKNLFKLESASITEQPVKIPFDFSERKSIPAGKEVGDSIVIRPITVRTWFKLRPLLLEIEPADLDKMIVKSDEPTSDFPVMMDKYGELLLDIVCLGIHNKPSEPPAWFRNVLIDNSTWEDIRIPRSIKLKPEAEKTIKEAGNRTVKTAPRVVKTSLISSKKVKTHAALQKKQAQKSMKAAREAKWATIHSVQTAKQSAKTAKATGRGLKAMAEAAAHAVKAAFAALMAGGGAVFVVLILIVGLIGGAAFLGNSQSSEVLSAEVLAHTPAIQKYASEFGIPEYVSAIQAIMMQESGGSGTDPMQASECPYNTQYPNTPGAIQDADYSIKVGIQYYADCVREAGCESPQDMDKLKLSLQGYNYGNGYISWALEKFGGYSKVNALQFSQEQAAAHGWSGYGDPEYVPHVMRYYSGGGWFTGLFGNRQLVNIAKSQLGNEGGEKFWSWYGFTSREEWCACFVSWCADQAGLIQSGAVPKFSLCTDGKNWFQNQGKWQGAGSMPSPGAIVFFDWEHDGTCDHVGIVERCDGTTVYTIEGNSGDAVKERSYAISSNSIMGYGMVVY